MVKNGLIALIIHGVIGFISFFVFTILINMVGAISLMFEDNEMVYYYISRIISVLLFLGAILLYFILARRFLEKDSKIKRLVIWIVSFFGVVLWILSYNLSDSVIKDVSQNINWALYCLYNAYFFPILVTFKIENPYWLILFAIVPSVLLWIGLEISSKKNKIT